MVTTINGRGGRYRGRRRDEGSSTGIQVSIASERKAMRQLLPQYALDREFGAAGLQFTRSPSRRYPASPQPKMPSA